MKSSTSLKIASVLLIVLLIFLGVRKIFRINNISFSSTNAPCVNDELKKRFNLIGENLITVSVNQDVIKDYLCVKGVNLNKQPPDKAEVRFIGRVPQVVTNIIKPPQMDLVQKDASPSSSSAILENITDEGLEGLIQTGSKFLTDEDQLLYSDQVNGVDSPQINILGSELKLGSKLDDSILKSSLTILNRLSSLGLSFKNPTVYKKTLLIIDNNPKRAYFSLEKNVDLELASLQLILQTSKMNSDLAAKEDTKLMEKIDLRFDKPLVVYSPKK